MMTDTRIIKELLELESEAASAKEKMEELQLRAYRLRNQLEGVSTPSARKGKKKGLSDADKRKIIDQYRKSLYKKAASGN